MLGTLQRPQAPHVLQRTTQRPLLRPPIRHSVAPRRLRIAVHAAADTEPLSYARDITKPRFVQHKTEAFWFYRFLSIVYDHIVNPGHWTVDMRTDALEPARLDNPNLKVGTDHTKPTTMHPKTRRWVNKLALNTHQHAQQVVDVGGGTGFCTQGIVEHVDPNNVTLLDQSPHQLDKARKKPDLQGVTILQGDAEDLPFGTDTFDRYVSAGSIEYCTWGHPCIAFLHACS